MRSGIFGTFLWILIHVRFAFSAIDEEFALKCNDDITIEISIKQDNPKKIYRFIKLETGVIEEGTYFQGGTTQTFKGNKITQNRNNFFVELIETPRDEYEMKIVTKNSNILRFLCKIKFSAEGTTDVELSDVHETMSEELNIDIYIEPEGDVEFGKEKIWFIEGIANILDKMESLTINVKNKEKEIPLAICQSKSKSDNCMLKSNYENIIANQELIPNEYGDYELPIRGFFMKNNGKFDDKEIILSVSIILTSN
ncbi:hypothetical protein SNEBB_003747 [Seison nebaliae]|nr:hypothetical protein SNEBB_003747 [Seison nebaliae]